MLYVEKVTKLASCFSLSISLKLGSLSLHDQANSSTPKVPIPPLKRPGQQTQKQQQQQLQQVFVVNGSNVFVPMLIGPAVQSQAQRPRWIFFMFFLHPHLAHYHSDTLSYMHLISLSVRLSLLLP